MSEKAAGKGGFDLLQVFKRVKEVYNATKTRKLQFVDAFIVYSLATAVIQVRQKQFILKSFSHIFK
jgi:hypothetical protein